MFRLTVWSLSTITLLYFTLEKILKNCFGITEDYVLWFARYLFTSLFMPKPSLMMGQHSGSLITVYHDDAFSPGKSSIERQPDDLFLLRNLLQLSDIWIQTRSLRTQMTGEVSCQSVLVT
jgi:hypothetical protein